MKVRKLSIAECEQILAELRERKEDTSVYAGHLRDRIGCGSPPSDGSAVESTPKAQ